VADLVKESMRAPRGDGGDEFTAGVAATVSAVEVLDGNEGSAKATPPPHPRHR